MHNLLVVLAFLTLLSAEDTTNWPQFRGPNASGIAAATAAPPVEFGPDKRVLWKQTLPAGHSSPVIWGDRIFVTSFDKDNNKLEILCLARKNGDILWRRAVPFEKLEKIHPVSSPASATPAVDGERVYAYFGSYGLIAFDVDGNQQWSVPLPPPNMAQSSGTSPVVSGELVILNRDEVENGYLLAVDRKSGKTVWKQPYPSGGESFSTPVIWHDQAVVHRRGSVDGFALKDGKRQWWAQIATNGTSTVVVDDNTVYAGGWTPVGEADQLVPLPDFATMLKKYDKDGDGEISLSEFPDDLAIIARPDVPDVPGARIYIKKFFNQMLDRNHDGKVQKAEWDGLMGMAKMMISASHGLMAIKPSGEGDVTKSIAWKEKIAIPEVPSPLLYDHRVYMIRNGGVATSLSAESGNVFYRERLGAGGAYYSSPIAANGKIYIASGDGTVVVFAAGGDKLEVLARNDLKEEIFATPAVAGGTLYVRTARALYAFGGK